MVYPCPLASKQDQKDEQPTISEETSPLPSKPTRPTIIGRTQSMEKPKPLGRTQSMEKPKPQTLDQNKQESLLNSNNPEEKHPPARPMRPSRKKKTSIVPTPVVALADTG